MVRLPRLVLPGIPYHVTQRGRGAWLALLLATSCTTAPNGISRRTDSFFAEVIGETVLLTRSADDDSCTLASGPDAVLRGLAEVGATERISVTHEPLPAPVFPPVQEGVISTDRMSTVRGQIVAPWCNSSRLLWITSFQRTHPAESQSSITISYGRELRPLPFRLNLAGEERPASLIQMVDLLSDAIPQHHLGVIGAYFGGPGYSRRRAEYDASIDFFHDLYVPEMLAEAQRTWRLGENSQLFESIECVGQNFPFLVALQIGVSTNSMRRTTDEVHLSDRAEAFNASASIARRLFEVCDGAR